ncbi:MAG: adenylyl-sulfate kinase [Nitrospirota bacterium]
MDRHDLIGIMKSAMSGMAIWITGLPGSGKSTVAEGLKQAHPEFVILRMDELRRVVTPEPTYSESERDLVYRSLVFLAQKLSELDHDVIIDATGNLRVWRNLARQLIPRFVEVYLRCSMDACIERERKRSETFGAPRDIYKKGAEGWPVPGTVVPYEEPLNAEVTIDTDKISVAEAIKAIENFLSKELWR